MTKIITPSVYVGTYEKYNSGSLQGEWVDLTQFSNNDEFLTYCAELHNDEKDPEFMFQDFEGFPRSFYSESNLNDDVWQFIEIIQDEDKAQALTDYLENGNSIDNFEDDYCGQYDSEELYGEEIFDECYLHDVPESIRYYIDYEKFTRDLFISDYWRSENGHVFRNS
jgi:antirestriction protein